MEERKKLAKEIKGKFNRRIWLIIAGVIPFILLAFIGAKLQFGPLVMIGVFGGMFYFALTINLQNMYAYASELMTCRVLVGKEISADPVAEGVQRIKSYGIRKMRSHSRSAGVVLYKIASGAMAAASVLDMIPGVKNFTFIYRNIVNRAYENAAKLIVTYQIGCYEEENQDMLYDLVTYFLQDSKQFILRHVKSEIKDIVLKNVCRVIFVVTVIVSFITTNYAIFAIALGIIFLYAFLSVAAGEDDDLNILCAYIEYVQSHDLDANLRAQVAELCTTGDNVLNIRDAVYNPTAYNLKKAVNSATELSEKYDKDLNNNNQ